MAIEVGTRILWTLLPRVTQETVALPWPAYFLSRTCMLCGKRVTAVSMDLGQLENQPISMVIDRVGSYFRAVPTKPYPGGIQCGFTLLQDTRQCLPSESLLYEAGLATRSFALQRSVCLTVPRCYPQQDLRLLHLRDRMSCYLPAWWSSRTHQHHQNHQHYQLHRHQ